MLPNAEAIRLVANDLAGTHPHHARKLREIAVSVARDTWMLDEIVQEGMDAAEAMAGATVASFVPPMAVVEGGRAWE